MSDDTPRSPTFTGGLNIAMKIPRADYDPTVAFYRDVLGLAVTEEANTGAPTVARTHRVPFGPNTLWLDCVESHSRSDIWLELRTDDVDGATARLSDAGIEPCDEIEPLSDPAGPYHWIRDPAGTVHLLTRS